MKELSASNIPYQDPEERNCEKCHGFIGIPGKIYGFAGKWCNCYMQEQARDADDKKWAKNNEEMKERLKLMMKDYEQKVESLRVELRDLEEKAKSYGSNEANTERIKNCKYVHISGSGYCRKCGGVHEIVKINPELKTGFEMIEKNLTRKTGE